MWGFRGWYLEPPCKRGSGIKDCLTFNITSVGEARWNSRNCNKELTKREKMEIAQKNLWLKLSFALLFITAQTMARPNPLFRAIYGNVFDKPDIEESKSEEANIEMKRVNSRMIDEGEISSSSQFWVDFAPAIPRHLIQAFSGALRLCDILR